MPKSNDDNAAAQSDASVFTTRPTGSHINKEIESKQESNPWRATPTGYTETGGVYNKKRQPTPGDLFDGIEQPRRLQRLGIDRSPENLIKIGSVLTLLILVPALYYLRSTKNRVPTSKPGIVASAPAASAPKPTIATIEYFDAAPLEEPTTEASLDNTLTSDLNDHQLLGRILNSALSDREVIDALHEGLNRKTLQLPNACVKIISHPSQAVRIEVAKILYQLKDRRTIPHLMVALEDQDPLVRMEITKALSNIGDRRVIGFLTTRYLAEKTPEVRIVIRKAIDQLNGFPISDEALLGAGKNH